jgi:6-phosphofructokinase 1
MLGDLKRGLLIRAESAHRYYSSDFILNLMKQEGQNVFTSRLNILGHIQQVKKLLAIY